MARLVYGSKDQFTVVSNDAFYDSRLSYRDIGLKDHITYLAKSQGERWNFSAKSLAALHDDGITSVSTSLKRLAELGYLVRGQKKSGDGLFGSSVYMIFDKPASPEEAYEAASANGVDILFLPDGRRVPVLGPGAVADGAAAPAPLPDSPQAARRPAPGKRTDRPNPGAGNLKGSALVSLSLKEPTDAELVRIDSRISALSAEGITEDELAEAYRLYSKEFRSRNGDDVRFAKKLVAWLTDETAYRYWVNRLRARALEEEGAKVAQVLQAISDEDQERILRSADPVFRMYVENRELARTKKAAGELAAAADEEKWDNLAYQRRRSKDGRRLIADEVRRGAA